jgi:hypothetical protein
VIRFPYLQLGLLTAGVAAVAMASQIAHLWGQIGLLAVAAMAVALTIRLDQTSENRMFPSHPLSLGRPIGTANWVMALSSVTHTVIGAYLPLSMQILHGADEAACRHRPRPLLDHRVDDDSHIHGRWRCAASSSARPGLIGLAAWRGDHRPALFVIVALNAVRRRARQLQPASGGSPMRHARPASNHDGGRHPPSGRGHARIGGRGRIAKRRIDRRPVSRRRGARTMWCWGSARWRRCSRSSAPRFSAEAQPKPVAADQPISPTAATCAAWRGSRHRLGRVVGEAHDDAGALVVA